MQYRPSATFCSLQLPLHFWIPGLEDEVSLNQFNLNSTDSASETHSPWVKRAVVAKKLICLRLMWTQSHYPHSTTCEMELHRSHV